MFWKRQDHGGSKKINGSQGLGMGRRTGWIGRAQRIFRAVKPLCVILLKSRVMFSKPIDCVRPRGNPHVNFGW